MKNQQVYTLPRRSLENIIGFQLLDFMKDFSFDKNGNIKIPYTYKGYSCNKPQENYDTPNVQAISFFSGCGGLDIGTQLAGVKVLSSLDFYNDAVETLKINSFFSHTVHMNKDINDVTGKDYDEILKNNNPEKLILVGGPPCQPFSKAGYWVTNEKRKANDDPRNMIGSYFRMISEIKPDGFLLENVESILHPSNKEAVDNIIHNCDMLGYKLSIIRTDATDYGIPQKRKRVFFLASKKPINATLKKTHGSFEECASNPELQPYERAIDWIAPFDNEKYWINEPIDTEGKWERELTCVPPGMNYIALSERENYPFPVFVAGKRYWSSLLKLHPLKPAWTIIASPGHWEGPFHWNNRRLSVRECASLQTFPEDYRFFGSPRSQRKQIGNAVPPLLGKLIVEELCKWI